MKLTLMILLSYFILWVYPVYAATMPIEQIELGKIIEISGQKYVKIGHDPVKGSQFMAFQPAAIPGFAEGMDMDKFTPAMCDSAPTPADTDYFLIGNLVDSRDGKWYEIRKFADGKCWMVDNLMYGGEIDACVNKTTFSGAGSVTPTNTFGTGTYGDCHNNPGSPTYGYLYNWQAAMQHASAYSSSNYTGPTTNVQGLCPTGWHLPSGDSAGEFAVLDKANGGTGAYSEQLNAITNFWRPGYGFKGVYSGYYSGYSGSLYEQGSYGGFWSSTQNTTSLAYYLRVLSYYVYPGTNSNNKNNGFSIRCVKN